MELAARYGGLELCHNDAVNLGNWGAVGACLARANSQRGQAAVSESVLASSVQAGPGSLNPMAARQSLQHCVFGSVGQVVAGLAAVQVPAVDSPCPLARLALAGYPYPLGR